MTRRDLASHAQAELASREAHYPDRVVAGTMSADEAGRGIAAWRAIVALLEHGETTFEPCLGETPAIAWAELLAVIHAAVEHRVGKPDQGNRLFALRQIRSLLIPSAIRQGVQIRTENGRQAPARLLAA
ncbi:MAG TPA: hypothetical protein VIL42_10500 [Sphingomicrobium sp.]|jgi:hypothetical protein